MQEAKQHYPIENVLPHLLETFQNNRNIVFSAPPGAGKTTQVPLALLSSAWMAEKKIIMLEPRRLAARRAAEYMANRLGEKVGHTVGYRIRGESVISKSTRIEVVTEGILTRLLQHEPDLPNAAIIIFDEFHERSIHADLGLAMTLDVQEHVRHDLRILVMSATLDVHAIARLLGDAPVLESKGQSFPVTTYYARFASEKPLEVRIVDTLMRALDQQEGDLLVFLPGRREIKRIENLLWEKHLPEDVVVHSLFGDAPYLQQSAALSLAPVGKRKIILSTSIAETSLTIDGVSVVIDAGLARTASFDVRRGMSGLVTIPVSKAVADQRRGRAGRQQPGICYRLWLERDHEALPEFPKPEIKSADLASLALDLAQWGTLDGVNMHFLDPPPAAHLAQARTLLQILGAIEPSGKLTSHGKAISDLPLHPRLAHMILRGKELGIGALACDIAALLEERDILSGKKDADIDLASRLHLLHQRRTGDEGVRERITAQSSRLKKLAALDEESNARQDYAPGILLALAYPDRIARRRERSGNRYLMSNGTTALLPNGSLLAREEFLAIGEVDGLGSEVHVFLAAPLHQQYLEKVFADTEKENEEIYWNENEQAVVARKVTKLGALVLAERTIELRGKQVLDAMLSGIRQMGLSCLPWDNESRAYQQRVQWLRKHFDSVQDIPDLSDAFLLDSLEDWISPFLDGLWKKSQLSTLPLYKILQSQITYDMNRQINSLAPSHLQLPSGSMVALDYSGEQPVLAVRLQELFGQVDTPKICDGRLNVVIHLLSPARRPLAVTQDLHSFWTTVYPEIRRQMRARYPKHVWPEDPLKAKPTNKTIKKKRTP
jgi:ATP-dependent helicase HrpB